MQKLTYKQRIDHLELYGWTYNDKHYRWDYLMEGEAVAWITDEAMLCGIKEHQDG